MLLNFIIYMYIHPGAHYIPFLIHVHAITWLQCGSLYYLHVLQYIQKKHNISMCFGSIYIVPPKLQDCTNWFAGLLPFKKLMSGGCCCCCRNSDPETQSIGIHDVFENLHRLLCNLGRFRKWMFTEVVRIFFNVFWPIFPTMKTKQDQRNNLF